MPENKPLPKLSPMQKIAVGICIRAGRVYAGGVEGEYYREAYALTSSRRRLGRISNSWKALYRLRDLGVFQYVQEEGRGDYCVFTDDFKYLTDAIPRPE